MAVTKDPLPTPDSDDQQSESQPAPVKPSAEKPWYEVTAGWDGFTKTQYLMIGAVAFLLQFFVTSGHLMSPDGEVMYRTAEAIALRGELHVNPLEFDEVSGQLLVPPQLTRLTVQGREGLFYGQYLPLQSVLSVPLIWFADITGPVFAEAFTNFLPDTVMHQRMNPKASWRRGVVAMTLNPLVQALTVILIIRLALLVSGGRRNASLITGALFLTTTMVWPHSRTFFTESLAALLILAAIECLIRWNGVLLTKETSARRLKLMILMGLFLGLSVWTRADSPLLVMGVALGLVLVGEFKRYRESAYAVSDGQFPIRDYLVSGGITLAFTVGVIAFNQWRFAENASLFGGGYGDESEGIKFSTPLLVGLQGFIFSPGKSILLFSPGIILGLWGWSRVPRQFVWLRWLMVIAFLPFAIGMLKWQNWGGGWCWGPRHIVQLHVPIMLGCLFLFWKPLHFWEKLVVYPIVTAGIMVQLFASTQSPLDFYHEMYRTPDDGLYYSLAYRPGEEQVFLRDFELIGINHEDDRLSVPVPPSDAPAPMTDSLYVPQHTQWNGYPVLFQAGYCDFLLLRIFGVGENKPDSTAVVE